MKTAMVETQPLSVKVEREEDGRVPGSVPDPKCSPVNKRVSRLFTVTNDGSPGSPQMFT